MASDPISSPRPGFLPDTIHGRAAAATAEHEAFAGRDELRYTGFTPNEPVGCH